MIVCSSRSEQSKKPDDLSDCSDFEDMQDHEIDHKINSMGEIIFFGKHQIFVLYKDFEYENILPLLYFDDRKITACSLDMVYEHNSNNSISHVITVHNNCTNMQSLIFTICSLDLIGNWDLIGNFNLKLIDDIRISNIRVYNSYTNSYIKLTSNILINNLKKSSKEKNDKYKFIIDISNSYDIRVVENISVTYSIYITTEAIRRKLNKIGYMFDINSL